MMLSKVTTGRGAVVARAAPTGAKASVEGVKVATGLSSRRSLLSGLMLMTGLSVVEGAKAETMPFLKSAGVRNIFEQEEEELLRLREVKEGEALRLLSQERELFEKEVISNQAGKLCATPFGVDVVGITELIFIIGATVAGITARQRKDEVERLNQQLREINLSLRQQARSGVLYAPGLTYAPTDSGNTMSLLKATLAPLPTPTPPAPVETSAPDTTASWMSMDEEDMNLDQLECRDALRSGKKLLKAGNGGAAEARFEKALILSRAMGDQVQQRRAVRGLAACSRLLGQYQKAIVYLERLLSISSEMNEFTGDADAYGNMADCYTDLGDFDKAATMYDKYIDLMNNDYACTKL